MHNTFLEYYKVLPQYFLQELNIIIGNVVLTALIKHNVYDNMSDRKANFV